MKSSLLDSSSPHHSLATFQAHALRTGLSPTSTVYTGTTYEYLTQFTLQSYGFQLHHVGGRGDRGVDLIGVWRIPLVTTSGNWKENKQAGADPSRGAEGDSHGLDGYEAHALKVLVQCKRLVGKHTKIGPNLIRELDGAARGARTTALFNAVFPQHQNGIGDVKIEEIQTDDPKEQEPRQRSDMPGASSRCPRHHKTRHKRRGRQHASLIPRPGLDHDGRAGNPQHRNQLQHDQ